jgi:hypothetical protein
MSSRCLYACDSAQSPPACGMMWHSWPVEIRDALTGAVCRPLGRNLVLSVPADSFRMLLIQRR